MNFLRLSGSTVLRDVLGGDRRAADDEEVDAGVDDGLVELLRALRARALRRPARPAARISARRAVTSSGLIGSA